MKKIFPLALCAFLASTLHGQSIPETPQKKEPINLSNRANDHLLVQLGYTAWAGKPDTINTSGLSKSINAYFMFDFPFKTNPKLSMAFGPGISSDHIIFTKTRLGIKESTPEIRFTNVADTNHFKKTKLAIVYFEAPIEFRYSADPLTGKGFKTSIGVKVGTLLNAHTRNTKFENRTGGSIGSFTLKEASKTFFNKTRLSFMGRVGMGHISLYGSYQLTPVFKDGSGPVVRPYSIGITLSGI